MKAHNSQIEIQEYVNYLKLRNRYLWEINTLIAFEEHLPEFVQLSYIIS